MTIIDDRHPDQIAYRKRCAELYAKNIPDQLKKQNMFGIAIAKQPLHGWRWKDSEKKIPLKEVWTWNKAIEQFTSNDRWLAKQREYFGKSKPEVLTGKVQLFFRLRGTRYWVADSDHRKRRFDNGDYILDDKDKKIKKDKFDDDQVEFQSIIVNDSWGYISSSGKGGHLWYYDKNNRLRKIEDAHVNELIDGKYLAQCELKHEVIFFPAEMQPINNISKINEPTPIILRMVDSVIDYEQQRQEANQAKKQETKQETKQVTGNDIPHTQPLQAHNLMRMIVAQCKWMNANQKVYLPNRKEFSGFIKRMKTLGAPEATIVELCQRQPDWNDAKDRDDILNASPYDDADKQVAIQLKKLVEFGYDKKADLSPYYADQTKITPIDWDNLKRADAVGDFGLRGTISLLAGKAGTGKSCLTLARVADVTRENMKVLYLSGDMNLVDMRPHLMANEAALDNVYVIDDLSLLNSEWLLSMMHRFRPDLVVMDAFIDCLACLTTDFLYDPDSGRIGKFDPNGDPLTWVKVFAWLRPWAIHWKVAVYGLVHPAKSHLGHELPHSSKLQGYLHRWDMLYKQGSNMKGFECRAAVDWLDEVGHDTRRLEFNGKRRSAVERMHTSYDLKVADIDLLHPDDRDQKIMVIDNKEEYPTTDNLMFRMAGAEQPESETIAITDDDVLNAIASCVKTDDSGWVSPSAVKYSFSRRDHDKHHAIDEIITKLAAQNKIHRKSSGRGHKIKLAD